MSIEVKHMAKVDLRNVSVDVKALILNMYSYMSRTGEIYSNYVYKDGIAYLPPKMDKLKVVSELLNEELVDHRSEGSPLGEPFVLANGFSFRDYQVEPANELVYNLKDHGSSTLSAATGAGKTVVMTYAYGSIGKKALILLDQSNLVPSWVDAARFIWDRDVQIIKSGVSSFGDISLATFQLLARNEELLKKIRSEYGTLVVDEAHTSAAESFRKVMSRLDNKHRVACSASYFRKNVATDVLNDFLAPVEVKMVNKNAIVPEVRWVDTQARWCSSTPMDFGCYILPELAANHERNALIFQQIKKYADEGRVIAVICITIAQAKMFDGLLKSTGIKSMTYTGTVTVKKDREIKELVESGKIKVVLTVKKLDKGLDWPSLDCMFMVRPGNNLRDCIQVAGRLTRIKEGKPQPILVDFRDGVKGSLAYCFANNRNKYYKQLGYKIAKEE